MHLDKSQIIRILKDHEQNRLELSDENIDSLAQTIIEHDMEIISYTDELPFYVCNIVNTTIKCDLGYACDACPYNKR
jgi:hypothetical protein